MSIIFEGAVAFYRGFSIHVEINVVLTSMQKSKICGGPGNVRKSGMPRLKD